MSVIEHTHEGKDARWWAAQSAHWHEQAAVASRQAIELDKENEALEHQLAGAVAALREIAEEAELAEADDYQVDRGWLGRRAREALGALPLPRNDQTKED